MTNPSLRRLAAHLAVALTVASTPLVAWGWAAASHVYMAKNDAKKAGQVDPNELCNRLYGSYAVDLFSNDFTVPGQTLHAVLHTRAMVVPELPWGIAANDAERAFAYGFASHNNTWGTDATAHVDGVTNGNAEGYVIEKAKVLAAALEPQVLPMVAGDREMLLLVSHILVEYSIDLLVAGVDPQIGQDLMASTACPTPAGVQLLVDALLPVFGQYLPPPLAEELIRKGEPAYRADQAGYGWVLTQPNARAYLAAYVAQLAAGFLPNPPEDPTQLVPLIDGALLYGMFLTQSDFLGELDATVGRVNGQMSVRKIVP